MDKLKLLDYEFEFVQYLEPVLDRNGNIMEERPQDRYPKNETKELNAYGEGSFCKFSINPRWSGVSGVYAFYVNDELVYVGQCLDFATRFNNGYGRIAPRACFVGGQSTNCKINQMVLEKAKAEFKIALYFHMTHNYHVVEKDIIVHYQPQYNKMLKNEKEALADVGKSGKAGYFESNTGKKATRKGREPQDKSQNPSTAEVREYVTTQILEAKQQGKNELVLQSGLIHKALGMDRAMPTVCSAMRTVAKQHQHDIVASPPKGNGSRLIFRFYW